MRVQTDGMSSPRAKRLSRPRGDRTMLFPNMLIPQLACVERGLSDRLRPRNSEAPFRATNLLKTPKHRVARHPFRQLAARSFPPELRDFVQSANRARAPRAPLSPPAACASDTARAH